MMDASKYSSIVRLLRVIVYVLHVVINNQKKLVQLKSGPTIGSNTHQEFNGAEMNWAKDIQYPMSKQANYGKV